MPTLKLSEHRRSDPVALTYHQQRLLRDLFDARLEPAEGGLVRVVPGARVGAAQIHGLDVVVAPKVPVDRIIHMIQVAADPFGWQSEDADGLAHRDLGDAIAALFARACEHAFGRGVYRTYRSEPQRLSHIKGRIDIARYLRGPLPIPVPVVATVHDDDVPENQVLRAACSTLRRSPHFTDRTREELARVWRVVGSTGDLADPLTTAQRISWSRHNAHYRNAIRLAEMVLAGQSIEVTAGRVHVPGFVVNMPAIVEEYVRVLIRVELNADESEMPRSWRGRMHLDQRHRIQLHPDLGMRRDGRWQFIGDVKYKAAMTKSGDSDEQGRRDDLYQLLAYVTEAGIGEGTLVYAGETRGATEHTVSATGARLRVVAVDLTASDVDQQVRAVVRRDSRPTHPSPLAAGA